MSLTELQLDRICFHIKVPRSSFEFLKATFSTQVSISTERLLQLVGDITDPAQASNLTLLEGQTLCTSTSLLGRCEASWNKLDTATIDSSMFVVKAGSVELTDRELSNRNKLYQHHVSELKRALNFDSGGRVGFNNYGAGI